MGSENRPVVARSWGWKGDLTSRGHERNFGDNDTVLYLDTLKKGEFSSSYTSINPTWK